LKGFVRLLFFHKPFLFLKLFVMNKLSKSLIIIFAILLIDQGLKIWIKTNMMLGQEYHIFDWFIIHFVENNGMAFGMELSGKFGKVVLSVFRIVAVVGIGWYLYKIARDEKSSMGLVVCVSMILAGAFGNIIDSVFYGLLFDASYGNVASFLPAGGGYAPFLHGKVVDMFYFPLWKGSYPDWLPVIGGDRFIFFRPVFNVADASISVGIMLLLIFQKRFLPRPDAEE
jgi:signal peptidase II